MITMLITVTINQVKMISGALPMLRWSRHKRFPAMGRFPERHLSRLLLYCQVGLNNNLIVDHLLCRLFHPIIINISRNFLVVQLSRLWPAGTPNPGDEVCVRADPRPGVHLRRRAGPRSPCDAHAARLGPPRDHGRPR